MKRAGAVAGVDGCRGGWLYALEDLRTGACVVGLLPRIHDVLLLRPAPAVIAIDIPIGLTEAGPRACDQEARKLLGRPRSSSVFPAPLRPMLGAASYEQACAIGRKADGRGITRETWNIVPKIREVDAFLRSRPRLRGRLHEAHPELCFFHWNGGRAVTSAKRTAEGKAERTKLVESQFGVCLDAARELLPRSGWAQDDLLDAFALLWSALRIARGDAAPVPARAPLDPLGLRMQIFA